MDRRTFALIVASPAAAALAGCQAEPAPVRLARLLGLRGEELAWIEGLEADTVREWTAALEDPSAEGAADRAADLALRTFAPRSRTFALVGYPQVPDGRTVCDGLLRE